MKINNFINKIDTAINNFRFNVSVAHVYELYNFFRTSLELQISNRVLKEKLIIFMKVMIPFTPHLAYECLELLKCKKSDKWPLIDKEKVIDEVKLAVQVNGKTRDIITIRRDFEENDVKKFIQNSKANKYIEGKKITKTIFVKNKIINYIVK